MKIRYSLLSVFLIATASLSQEVRTISKPDLLQNVLQNGNTLKIQAQHVIEAKGDLNQANAVFLPSISASYTGMTTTNPLMAFGSKLNQEVLTASDFNPQLLNDPLRTDNFATKLEVRQPLINLDGIYQRKAAKSKFEAAQFQESRSREYLELQVDEVYMQLQLAYKMKEVIELSKTASEENLRIANNSFKQGLLQRSDLLAAEVQVLEIENRMAYAQSNIENISGHLSVLMNDTSDAVYRPSESLEPVNENIATHTLPSERADLRAMLASSKAYEQQYQSNKMSFLPRLNAFGSYELYDNEFLQADANGYLVGAQLSWDLFDGNKRFGKAQKSKAAYERSAIEYDQYLAESKLELEKAHRMLSDAANDLALSKKALEQYEESLRIRKNRFREGLERTSDLLFSEAKFAEKQLEYYQTVFQYNYAQAYLRFLTKK
ncbi:MAG: TolC family protein [Bacteroidia bacterium]|nr:TolC family protein [Bacteroidia bacterium]MBT8275220.1 TolC family protein [Bacteroidia bacterium]NNJ83218.1 TolC family protein [Flavobacteriaceae bacterium]NNK55328.1 TolC family protein [Flavobacteriaceae bacterium]NNM09650.1 TolC family protein [Flavobacteriaceae bacterium]